MMRQDGDVSPITPTFATDQLAGKMKALINDPAAFGTLAVTVGVFVAAIFSYLLQFLLGRLLTVGDYGTFNAFLALVNICAVPASVLGTSLVKLVSELKAQEKFDKLTVLFWNLFAFCLFIGTTAILLTFIFRYYLAQFLKINDTLLPLQLGLLVASIFLFTIPSSYLQGLLRFKAYAFFQVFEGALRFALPVLLVLAGLGLWSVFFGISLSAVISFVVSLFLLSKNFRIGGEADVKTYYKRIFKFGIAVAFVNMGLMLLNNVDIILVKRLFSEETAGYYAGIVTVGKVFLFGAGTVGVVMFPQISEAYTRKANYWRKFVGFLTAQLLLVSGGILVFSLFPKLITAVMFGDKFMPAVAFLPRFSLFVALYVLINFLIMFLLAIEKTKVFIFQVPAILAQCLLIMTFHRSLVDIINVNIAVSFVLLIMIVVYAGFHYRSGVQTGQDN